MLPTHADSADASADASNGRGHLLDLYLPAPGAGPAPVLIWTDGSAFLGDEGKAGAGAAAELFVPRRLPPSPGASRRAPPSPAASPWTPLCSLVAPWNDDGAQSSVVAPGSPRPDGPRAVVAPLDDGGARTRSPSARSPLLPGTP